MRADVVLRIGIDLGISRETIKDGLGRGLRIDGAHDFDALDTVLDLGRRRLDENLTRTENRAKLVANVDLGDAKDDREARVGLAVLRTHPALDNVAGRVLDG